MQPAQQEPTPEEIARIHQCTGQIVLLPGRFWRWATSSAARPELAKAVRNGVQIIASAEPPVGRETHATLVKTGWEHHGVGYRLVHI